MMRTHAATLIPIEGLSRQFTSSLYIMTTVGVVIFYQRILLPALSCVDARPIALPAPTSPLHQRHLLVGPGPTTKLARVGHRSQASPSSPSRALSTTRSMKGVSPRWTTPSGRSG